MMCQQCLAWRPETEFVMCKGIVWHQVPTAHTSKKPSKVGNHMSDNDIRTLLQSIQSAIGAYLDSDDAPDEAQTQTTKTAAKKAPAKKAATKKADPEPEPEPEDETTETEDDADEDIRAELSKLSVAALRKRAIAQGFDPADVKGADKADLIDSIAEDIEETEGGASGDGDADSDETETDETDESGDADGGDADERRAELEGMTLAALRKFAREELDAEPSEVRSLDKPGLIDLILDSESDDDSDAGMDETESGDPEGDEDGYTRDELEAMDKDALMEIIEEWEIDPPAKKVKPVLIKTILAAQG